MLFLASNESVYDTSVDRRATGHSSQFKPICEESNIGWFYIYHGKQTYPYWQDGEEDVIIIRRVYSVIGACSPPDVERRGGLLRLMTTSRRLVDVAGAKISIQMVKPCFNWCWYDAGQKQVGPVLGGHVARVAEGLLIVVGILR
jgi:hypothetical protein